MYLHNACVWRLSFTVNVGLGSGNGGSQIAWVQNKTKQNPACLKASCIDVSILLVAGSSAEKIYEGV